MFTFRNLPMYYTTLVLCSPIEKRITPHIACRYNIGCAGIIMLYAYMLIQQTKLKKSKSVFVFLVVSIATHDSVF